MQTRSYTAQRYLSERYSAAAQRGATHAFVLKPVNNNKKTLQDVLYAIISVCLHVFLRSPCGTYESMVFQTWENSSWTSW